jgi:hypothetical protein
LLGNQAETVSIANNAASKPAGSDSTRQATWATDRIVFPSEAKELFERILNGNYPPIMICGSEFLRKNAEHDGKILFTTNFNRIYYEDDDPVKLVRIGDGLGWQYIESHGGEVLRGVSLIFLKNSMSFVDQYSPDFHNMSYQEMLEVFDYGELGTMLIIYSGSDGNKYIDVTDW